MGTIGYGYGSEWHLLRYLGYHRQALNTYVLSETGGSTIDWLDFPFSSTGKHLGDDGEWTGVKFIPDAHVKPQWKGNWPSTGSPPNWDAVGRLSSDDPDNPKDWLLVEVKAHVGEMESQSRASPASKKTIHAALEATAKKVTHGGALTPSWEDGFYQYANRLAVLDFLTNVCSPMIPARLIFLYFYGERVAQMRGCKCPPSQAEWQPHLDEVYRKLDINPQAPLMQKVHHVFVPIHSGV